jgi:hypothetical protein
MNKRQKNMIGVTFNKLTVIESAGRRLDWNGKPEQWRCICECGNERIVVTSKLQTGYVKSCGCTNSTRIKPNRFRAKRTVFTRYKIQAEKRNLSFNLKFEDFLDLIQEKCYYCDESPKNLSGKGYKGGSFFYNGIDRINSALGYELENCVTCCKICNKAKDILSQDEFYKWIFKLHSNLIIKKLL